MISAVIHTKNQTDIIERCLSSVTWVDEIVVIDMHCTDDTIDKCRKFTDKIFRFDEAVDYVEPARNFGISKATSDWVLLVDADEVIPDTLQTKLRELERSDNTAWKLPRKNIMFGHWIRHAGWWPDYNVRFFKKGTVNWPVVIHGQPEIYGEVGELPPDEHYAIVHYNYATVSDFVDRLNKYTTITVNGNSHIDGQVFDSFWNEFLKRFFLMDGHKDGELGLSVSLLQSFYQLVTFLKQWEKDKAGNRHVNVSVLVGKLQKELAYWLADYQVKHSRSLPSKLYWQFRRKYKV